MSNFIVSARKYRPQRFEDVVGQQHVAGTLRSALATDHLAHAFLFTGPRGVGKTTCARILAKVINCEAPTSGQEACNNCNSCTAFKAQASFNIIELDAASNNSVEHIRSLIEQVRIPPQNGRYKVFIIDEVHMLSSQAFNAFLKTLEEPPGYAVFILATTEKHKIIPTILSRCQIFDFRRIAVPDMVAHLQHIAMQEGVSAEQDALHIIAQKADGALRDALSIFDRMTSSTGKNLRYTDVIDQLNVLDWDYYFGLTDALISEDISTTLTLFDKILSKGFDPEIAINGLSEHMRNLLVCKNPATYSLLEVGDALRSRYLQQSEIAAHTFMLTALSLLNDCDVHFKMAKNKRLHVEMTLIRICYSTRAAQLAQSPNSEKKKPEPNEPVTAKEPSVTKGAAVTPGNAVPLDQKAVEALKKNIQHGVQKVERIPLRLDAFEEAVAVDEARRATLQSKLNLENATHYWLRYAETVESPSLQQAFIGSYLTLENKTLIAKVGMSLHKNALTQALGKLLPDMQQALQDPLLRIRVDVDDSLQPPEPARPARPASAQEKLDALKQMNPLVEALIERLGLRIIE
jgi:DNA polymerase-3 subunit gamma/tau